MDCAGSRLPRLLTIVVCCAAWLPLSRPMRADDWPMWRYDAGRTAASTERLPERLQLQWTRELSPRTPAWDDALNRDLMTYDRLFEPVVHNGRLFLGFNDRDKLVAYDAATGRELWSYHVSGPVRLPPAAWNDRVYFVSDDGHLYCLNAADGSLQWSFRGGPNSRQILGNQRLISAWPMRGGPVIRDGTVYVAAGIWPFMGTFLYALDALTGDVVWVNDETGSQYLVQPHSSPSFAGVAPQGALVATQDVLLVPGGRSVPAAFDRHTGKMLYFELNAGGKATGGSFVAANEESWFVHTRGKGTREFSLQTGVKTAFQPNEPVLAGDRLYAALTDENRAVVRAFDSRSKEPMWDVPVNGLGDLILAGDRLYAAGHADAEGHSTLTAIRLPTDTSPAAVEWTATVPGSVERLVGATGRLFAVTREGRLFAFGADAAKEMVWRESPTRLQPKDDSIPLADQLLQAGAAEGYALWLGADDESLLMAMAERSPFVELTVVAEDGEQVDRLRRTFDAAGKYGSISVRQEPLSEFQPPPYVANMIFVGGKTTASLIAERRVLARLYESVRPYGGVLCLMAGGTEAARLRDSVADMGLEQAEIDRTPWGVVVRRVGPLPGAGTWTHQYGNVANTIKSDDRRVKLPLGVLWFGGVSHDDILPRHGHGPPEQVVGGRLFIQGINSLTARDVYTGRVLWRRNFNDLGTFDVYFDDTYEDAPLDSRYNQVHIPGANARGTNYVVTDDRIYLVEGAVCHVLDTATGNTVTEIALPQDDPARPNEWGYIGVWGDVLIGGVGFARYRSRLSVESEGDSRLSRSKQGFGLKSLDRAASLALVGFDRHTGRQLWRVEAKHSFWHNGIVAGNNRVFALDKNPKPVEEFLRRRGKSAPETYRILAFDVQSGEVAWEVPGDVFGTWLSYSEAHDLLLQAGAAASDRLSSEVAEGMAVYKGRTGEVVWRKDDLNYSGPCVLHNDLIITNANSYAQSAGAFRLTDGEQKMIPHPLTGELQPWTITRAYGCNSIVASENLLTFRSGAAGFYDLLNHSGTGNFGGFRSGCTANLIAADGVLNAPDYTRTCSCAYQNQTSLALVHMPEIDAWTISNAVALHPNDGRVRQVAINLGAPGDRRDPHGQMWLEYPAVAGDSPNFGLELEGEPRYFQQHPSTMKDAALPWVASSGVEGVTRLTMSLKALPLYSLRTGIPVDHLDDDAEEAVNGDVKVDGSTVSVGQAGDARRLSAFRFNDIRLAQDSEIKSATLQLTSRVASDAPAEWIIRAEASGNAARFENQPRNLSGRTLTSSHVRWNLPAWPADAAGPEQSSPDLAPLIREVVSRDDWRPGNSIVLVVTGAGERVVGAFRGRNAVAARLIVDAEEVDPNFGTAASLQPYRVKLHFGVPRGSDSDREFDVAVGGHPPKTIVLSGRPGETRVVTFEQVLLGDAIELTFKPKTGRSVLSGLELQPLAR